MVRKENAVIRAGAGMGVHFLEVSFIDRVKRAYYTTCRKGTLVLVRGRGQL